MRWPCALACGFLIWVIPAGLDFLLYSHMSSIKNILDVLLVSSLVLATIICAVRYFKTTEDDFLIEGIGIGTLWFLMAIAFGLAVTFIFPMYTPRVYALSVADFLLNVGVFFLLVPVITASFGYILEKKIFEK